MCFDILAKKDVEAFSTDGLVLIDSLAVYSCQAVKLLVKNPPIPSRRSNRHQPRKSGGH
jgi:hypothetical protein